MSEDEPLNRDAAAADRLSFRLDNDLAARLSTFQRRNPGLGGPEDAVRHILRLWLTENGFDGAHEDLGRRPETLNASNDD